MVIFQCVPVQAYWDKSIANPRCPFNEANFFFATILVHTTMDCIILILPVIEVMKMTLPLSQKLAVVGLFTSGTVLVYSSEMTGFWLTVGKCLRCVGVCAGTFETL
jgi:hypothetical protein